MAAESLDCHDAQLEMLSDFWIHFLIRLRDDHLLFGLRRREEACGLAWNAADRQAGPLLKSSGTRSPHQQRLEGRCHLQLTPDAP